MRSSILKIIKDKIQKILPNFPDSFILIFFKMINLIPKLKNMKIRLINLSYINLIREKNLNFLSNNKLLESELLPKLGLNDESLFVYPKDLYSFCGIGLFSWQYPNQFSKFLIQLSKFKIKSYLEIGTRHGGTFIIIIEYLNKFTPIKYAIGVDIGFFPSLIKYKKINPRINFIQIDSQSSKFESFIRNSSGFDLVLIDGNHDEMACRNDFNTIKNKANIIAFHDIVNDYWPSVKKIWNEIKINYSAEYIFFEYSDQYESVTKRTGQSFLGIGIAVKKTYLKKIGYNLS